MSQGLAARGASALMQSYAANLAKVVLQFAIGTLLARLLGPEAFGLVAIAWLIVGFGTLLMDAGISSSVIQREDIDDSHVAWAFYAQLVLGMVLFCVVFVASPNLAAWLGNRRAEPLLQAMGLTFAIKSAGQTSFALLNRGMRFGTIQAVTVTTYFIGYGIVGIACALAKLGAWSVIAAHLTQTSLTAAAYIWFARPPVKTPPRIPRDMLSFGWKTMLAGFLSWLFYNIDNLSISRMSSPTILGLYNRSMTLVNMPIVIVSSLQPLLFAASSRIQRDDEKLRTAFLACTSAVGMTVTPILLVTALVSDRVIVGIYGEAWRSAAAITTPVAIAVAINAYSWLAGPLLMAKNATLKEIYALFVADVLMALALPVAAQRSVEVVSWSILAFYLLRFVLVTSAVLRTLSLNIGPYLNSLVRPILLMVPLPAIAGWAASRAAKGLEPGPALLLVVLASGLGFVTSAVVSRRVLMGGPLGEVLTRSGKVPSWAVKWFSMTGSLPTTPPLEER